MGFSLQMKYAQNTYRKGDCVGVRPERFSYCEGDCLSKWLESGRDLSDWRYPFAIIYISDEGMSGEEAEVSRLVEEYLTSEELLDIEDEENYREVNNPDNFNRRWYIELPEDYEHPVRKQLRELGESVTPWSVILPYIRERV